MAASAGSGRDDRRWRSEEVGGLPFRWEDRRRIAAKPDELEGRGPRWEQALWPIVVGACCPCPPSCPTVSRNPILAIFWWRRILTHYYTILSHSCSSFLCLRTESRALCSVVPGALSLPFWALLTGPTEASRRGRVSRRREDGDPTIKSTHTIPDRRRLKQSEKRDLGYPISVYKSSFSTDLEA